MNKDNSLDTLFAAEYKALVLVTLSGQRATGRVLSYGDFAAFFFLLVATPPLLPEVDISHW